MPKKASLGNTLNPLISGLLGREFLTTIYNLQRFGLTSQLLHSGWSCMPQSCGRKFHIPSPTASAQQEAPLLHHSLQSGGDFLIAAQPLPSSL